MKLPIRLKNPPIVDSIFEIRFESKDPPDLVPGLLTNILRTLGLDDIQPLHTLQIPEQIRTVEKTLQYSPYYKAKLEPLIIQFGPRMIALSSPTPYIGWEKFRSNIEKVLKELFKSGLVKI